jgi:hypothetical protein
MVLLLQPSQCCQSQAAESQVCATMPAHFWFSFSFSYHCFSSWTRLSRSINQSMKKITSVNLNCFVFDLISSISVVLSLILLGCVHYLGSCT